MFLSILTLFNLGKFLTNKEFIFNDDKYMFKSISDIHLELMGQLAMTEISKIGVKDDFNIKVSNNNCVLHNYYFKNSQFKKIRLSYLMTNETQMFNSVWYPSYDYDCPILSVDLVNFNKDKSLCLINLVNMYTEQEYLDKYETPFINIKKKYPELSESKTLHLYPFRNFISRAILYSNVYNSTNFDTIIPKALNEYLDIYTNLFNQKSLDKNFIQARHGSYNDLRYEIEKKNYLIKNYIDKDCYNNILNEYYF
jgi:hypothetical protein